MQWKSNKLTDLKKQYREALKQFYEEREADTMLSLLIRSFFGLSRSDMALNPDYRLSESEMLKLHFAVKELKNYKPVQYIIKKTEFLNVTLKVNENVLIPRPETEEMVSMIIDREKQGNLRVLDIGTGSGCIAIALAKNLTSPEVWGIDISDKALQLAAENAKDNNVFVNFQKLDILQPPDNFFSGKFDVIVSNPPYVTEQDKKLMQENVIRYEPHEALFVPGDDPLLFYRAILYFAGDHLKSGGRVYLEVNEQYGKEVADLLSMQDYSQIALFKDIHEKNRFVAGVKNKPRTRE
ncbi:MAG: peptide chain release factor N(5)-glutamine methyltransferase [Chlorobi bacterium]|nr:peptide chain release factor N(5)-glutamine methyltransferase [Chlorobiota bacterium]